MSIEQIQAVVKLLKVGVRDLSLVPVANIAIDMLQGVTVITAGGAERKPQSSKSVARIHAANQSAGKFGSKELHGLPESVSVLNARDCLVHLAYVQSTEGMLSVWYEADSGTVRGIVVAFNNRSGAAGRRTGGSDRYGDIDDDRI